MVRNLTRAKIPALKGAQIFRADIRDSEAIRSSIKDCDAVIHFAAILGNKPNSWADFRSVNVEGTRLLAEAAIEAKVKKFVYVSAVWVYGLNAKPGTNEKSPRRFSNDPYSDTKLEAENIILELCHKKGLPAIIVQPTYVYGPGDETWTLTPIKLVRNHLLFLPEGGNGLMQPVFIDDLVDGIMAAFFHGKIGNSYILCGPEVVIVKEFFTYLAHMIGKTTIPSIPGWIALLMAQVLELVSRFGRYSIPFTRCSAWMVNEGHLQL